MTGHNHMLVLSYDLLRLPFVLTHFGPPHLLVGRKEQAKEKASWDSGSGAVEPFSLDELQKESLAKFSKVGTSCELRGNTTNTSVGKLEF